MATALRYVKNPILTPNPDVPWESVAAFNGCPILSDDGCHMLYRAQSGPVTIEGRTLEVSTVGHAISFNRVSFLNRRKLIAPSEPWEKFGCEDPRVTYLDGRYYIFYTALSQWPPSPDGIKVAVAVTRDFFHIEEKYLVTPFNAKAMTMFPERINGKITVLLTANSDIPPSTIGIRQFDSIAQLTDQSKWLQWYDTLESHKVDLLRTTHDHVEIGAPPIKTPHGWLLIYSYIKSYLTSHKFFGIEAVLLDSNQPQRIIKRTADPILFPEFEYERVGNIQNIVFPSGAILYNDVLGIYYGACDTNVCLATLRLDDLLSSME